ncbi:semaphorin-4A [Lampris incognitus]|uniref:semaphorin-4A n=1 Tax=Lampris incognitus TaxID=2546036 RepID=UPI0024B4C603|nr:semaphorin-4A [Lampris incognitus]
MRPAGLLSVLLGLLDASGALAPPRISFNLDSPGRPLVHFKDPTLHKASTLLLSKNSSTLYVGARDAVLKLDVGQPDVISLKRKVEWKPSQVDLAQCADKRQGKTADCPNFIRVLQHINSTHLYACGSFAYNPRDVYIDRESLSLSPVPSKTTEAKGRCPFNPFQRNTAITIGGELFTATTLDFRGIKPVISRHLSKGGRPDVKQDSSMKLLEEPSFVGSSFDHEEGKLYFFFSEVGKEFSFLDELQVARVAQVCKDDTGGQRTLQRHWTSFAKAQLLCRPPKQLPFNVLQDMFTLQPPDGDSTNKALFYGVFTSQWSMSVGQSAVCVFTMEVMRSVFSGDYKTFDMSKDQWSLQRDRNSKLGTCGLGNATDAFLGDVKKTFLTSSSVRPVGDTPLLVSGEIYTRMVAVRTSAANGKEYTVLFLLTESGYLHKVVLLDRGPWVIEEIQVFKQAQLLPTLLASPTKGVVFVGWSDGVTRVPLADCSYYSNCIRCVQSRDPFCGWDPIRAACTRVNTHQSLVQDLENGDIGKICPGPQGTIPVIVSIGLNELVRLECRKPSNFANVSWTSTRINILPPEAFYQRPDGSLVFFGNAGTVGNYSCLSIEEGHKEVVENYIVSLTSVAVPHAPYPRTNHPTISKIPQGQNPPQTVNPKTKPAGVTEESHTTAANENQATSEGEGTRYYKTVFHNTALSESFTAIGPGLGTPTRKELTEDQQTNPRQTREEKNYRRELVAVSLLLCICIFLLLFGGLYSWHHWRTALKSRYRVTPEGGGVQSSLENIPSLTADNLPTEVKATE